VARARAAGVAQLVLPAVEVAHFAAVRELAHAHGFAYAPNSPRSATTRCWWPSARSGWITSCPAWTASARSASTSSS
jgi:hypothetical protein